jgi:hypothetical protein
MKYELFKVKRGKELLGEYIMTDIWELMETGVLLPSDIYKSKGLDFWLPLKFAKNEQIKRTPTKKPTISSAEAKLQRQFDTLANQSLFLTSNKRYQKRKRT